MRKLINLCRTYREQTSSTSELKSIVESSYSIASAYKKRPKRLRYDGGKLDRPRLFRLMRFVGRARTSYHTFLAAAFRFPSFQKIELILVPPVATESRVTGTLKIPLPEDIKDCHEASETAKNIADIIARYDELCGKPLHVHAEIGLLFHLLRQGFTFSKVYPYIGISKQSCFLCNHILLDVGIFRNRGCHGDLETQWTLPRSFELSSEHSERIFLSFLKLQTLVSEKSKILKKTRMKRKLKSEAVVSDCISMDDRLELAARMEISAQIREDQWDAGFWERQD